MKVEETARQLLDARNGQRLVTFKADSVLNRRLDFSLDFKLAVAGTIDGKIWVWEVATGEPIAVFTGHTSEVTTCAFSSDGKILASGDNSSTIKLWDLVEKRGLKTLRASSGMIRSIDFSPDQKTLATSSHDGVLTLWSVASGRELMTLSDLVSPNSFAVFTAGAGALLCGGEDGRLYAFRAPSWAEIK